MFKKKMQLPLYFYENYMFVGISLFNIKKPHPFFKKKQTTKPKNIS